MTEHDTTQFGISVGRMMRSVRRQRGVTLEQAGRMVGVSYQQMQKYEHGHNQISSAMIYRYAEAMRWPVTAFFDSVDGQGESVSKPFPTSRTDLADARAAMKIESRQVRAALYALILAIGDRDADGPAKLDQPE